MTPWATGRAAAEVLVFSPEVLSSASQNGGANHTTQEAKVASVTTQSGLSYYVPARVPPILGFAEDVKI